MLRTICALTILCLTASAALAKDLCIQIDSGSLAGSNLVLKKAKVTRRSVAPVGGYLARYNAMSNRFDVFWPVYGQSIVNTPGFMAIGLTVQRAGVFSAGTINSVEAPQSFSMDCNPGADGRINAPDYCSTYINGTGVSTHVVDCVPEARNP
jgi:hypothetical protein